MMSLLAIISLYCEISIVTMAEQTYQNDNMFHTLTYVAELHKEKIGSIFGWWVLCLSGWAGGEGGWGDSPKIILLC